MKAKNKELPWKQMVGMRNKLIHAYFGIDVEILWKAVKASIPHLNKSIEKMLKDQRK